MAAHYEIAERLAEMARIVQQSTCPISMRDLADQIGVSRNTVARYISTSSDFEVVRGRYGGVVWIGPDSHPAKKEKTSDEAKVLTDVQQKALKIAIGAAGLDTEVKATLWSILTEFRKE